jgi:ataxia telangiectasia mutated family protein
VPFRLTRNIVDGMGPTGIEGTFTKAAEATMTVLKLNSNALLTILSAIVSDPLYKWNVSPVKARQRQLLSVSENDDDDSAAHFQGRGIGADDPEDELGSEKNEAAANAIAKIQEKLQGYEDGTSGEQQSVEGQVQLLINSAKDPDNLCDMYVGWGPWM